MPAVNYPLFGAPQYALTGGPQVFRVFTPTSQGNMVTQLVSALVAASWSISSTITRGYQLLVRSPQGYTAFLDVYSIAGSNSVAMQFMSATGSGAVGFQHILDYQDSQEYQIVCNPCGFFVSRPGVYWSVNVGSAACGGIPRCDEGCGFGTEPITEIWFSFGDYNAGYYPAYSPHIALDNGLPLTYPGSQEGNYQGNLVYGGGNGTPRVLRISCGAQSDAFVYDHPVWVDGVPILYPAFVAWGDTTYTALKIRGQIYDAACRSKSYPGDATDTWDGLNWMNYTSINPADRQYEGGSLWLMTSPEAPVPPGDQFLNVAY